MGPHEKLPDRQQIYRDWIETERQRVKKSRSAFFSEAGVDKSVASKFFNPKLSVNLEDTTIDRLARHWGRPHPLMTTRPAGGAPQAYSQPEVAPVNGNAAPGPRSTWIINSRVLELAGCMIGDEATMDSEIEPREDDIVIAEIVNPESGARELAVRRYRVGRPPYLVVDTVDPVLKNIAPDYVDGQRVRILGTVIEIRRERGA